MDGSLEHPYIAWDYVHLLRKYLGPPILMLGSEKIPIFKVFAFEALMICWEHFRLGCSRKSRKTSWNDPDWSLDKILIEVKELTPQTGRRWDAQEHSDWKVGCPRWRQLKMRSLEPKWEWLQVECYRVRATKLWGTVWRWMWDHEKKACSGIYSWAWVQWKVYKT